MTETANGNKIYRKPWYKERAQEKHIKSLYPNTTMRFIDSRNWIFLKKGLDDFHNGMPPPPTDDIFVKSRGGAGPVLTNMAPQSAKRSARHSSNQFSHDNFCFSRVSPLQKQRIEQVEMIEQALKKHPLALYPHLEECVPPELFDDVVSVLDPEMLDHGRDSGDDLSASYSDISSTDHTAARDDHLTPDPPPEQHPDQYDFLKVRNPYRWLPDTDESDVLDKKPGAAEPRRALLKSDDDEEVKSVTQQFCEWVASLGGDSNNIDEATVTSMFASGYETKPALSVPIHVAELANVPPELHLSTSLPPEPPQPAKLTPRSLGCTRKSQSAGANVYTPSWVKQRYGAWYLQPNLWKKHPVDEPLQDPKEPKNKEVSEAKSKSLQLDHELAPMHGVKLFREFVDTKDSRTPEFLEHISELQAQQQQRDEQAYHDAELQLQRPRSTTVRL